MTWVIRVMHLPVSPQRLLSHHQCMPAWVYILSSSHGTLYTGCTSDLHRRVLEHRNGIHSRLASKYGCHRLVWFEELETIQKACAREQQIKGWTRARKIDLIAAGNPTFLDRANAW